MRIWPALLLAPLMALADQLVAFAIVGWACAQGRPVIVHAVHAAFLVAAAATLPAAWREWKRGRACSASASAGAGAGERKSFLAILAVGSAALSVLVIAALWLPTWLIAPCVR